MMSIVAASLTGACAPGGVTGPGTMGPTTASFLTDDLLQVELEVSGGVEEGALRRITDCAAAEAILLRGNAFARHVRTTLVEEAGNSRADAVYTVSPTLPAGAFAIDAQTTAEACREQGLSGV